MELKLEELEYQRLAIQSVVKIFEGNEKNTFGASKTKRRLPKERENEGNCC